LPADFSYRRFDQVLDDAKKPERHLARLLEPLEASYDLVILDCPPSVSLLSEAIFFAADVLLVPVIPTTLSLRTLEQIEGFVAEKGPRRLRLAPFFSMVDGRKSLHREVVADPAGVNPLFLMATIPYASAIERMGLARAPLPAYAPANPASSAYLTLWREVRGLLS
jgi:cellulose biosynthesis protein BcsQ